MRECLRATLPPGESRNTFVASNGQKLHLFQMHRGTDKIARRDANRGNKRLFGLTYH
jgi:hypothetical protein